jgi:hypothetical protein
MEELGITKADLKIVPHGLRHRYAADEYQAATGHAPPVEGGAVVDRELDRLARRQQQAWAQPRADREGVFRSVGVSSATASGSLDVATSSESSPAA